MTRIARLYDGAHPETGPYFSADRGRVDDPAEQARLLSFLRGGKVILFATSPEHDVLDASTGRVVDMSFRTDGVWVWSDGVAYYLQRHGVGPDVEFYQHIRTHRYVAPVPAEHVAQQALDALYEAGRSVD